MIRSVYAIMESGRFYRSVLQGRLYGSKKLAALKMPQSDGVFSYSLAEMTLLETEEDFQRLTIAESAIQVFRDKNREEIEEEANKLRYKLIAGSD